jgi:4-hydroxy-tetrahydrodipicolinate reductase
MMGAARVTIIGATGRMGQALIRCLAEFPGLVLHAAVTEAGHPDASKDAGELAGRGTLGIHIGTDVLAAVTGADVAIDFSSAQVSVANAVACAHARVPLLLGTTGLGAEAQAELASTARHVPLLVAANTSLALNLLLELVRRAAQALPERYDIEIVEAHHRHKVDAPSGTALALGQAAADGRGITPASPALPTGTATGPRVPGAIGYAVLRGGDVVGEHEVRFLGSGEELRLGHIATDRTIFARGALTAALWLVGRPPGRYTMADVLSI